MFREFIKENSFGRLMWMVLLSQLLELKQKTISPYENDLGKTDEKTVM